MCGRRAVEAFFFLPLRVEWRCAPWAGVRPRRKEGERGKKTDVASGAKWNSVIIDLRFFKEQLRVEV